MNAAALLLALALAAANVTVVLDNPCGTPAAARAVTVSPLAGAPTGYKPVLVVHEAPVSATLSVGGKPLRPLIRGEAGGVYVVSSPAPVPFNQNSSITVTVADGCTLHAIFMPRAARGNAGAGLPSIPPPEPSSKARGLGLNVSAPGDEPVPHSPGIVAASGVAAQEERADTGTWGGEGGVSPFLRPLLGAVIVLGIALVVDRLSSSRRGSSRSWA